MLSQGFGASQDTDFLAQLWRRMWVAGIYHWNTGTATVTGSGTTGAGHNGRSIATGVTALSTSRYYNGTNAISPGAGIAEINFGKNFIWLFQVQRSNTDAECIARIQLKAASAEGALGAVGIGLQIDNLALSAEGWGAHLATTALATNLSNAIMTEIMIVHTAGVSDKWYVNGVLKLTEVDVNHIPSGLAASMRIMLSIINGATGGVDNYLHMANMKFWSEK